MSRRKNRNTQRLTATLTPRETAEAMKAANCDIDAILDYMVDHGVNSDDERDVAEMYRHYQSRGEDMPTLAQYRAERTETGGGE